MFTTLPTNQRVKDLTGTKNKKFNFITSDDNSAHHTGSYWSSGTRYYYSVYNIKTGERKAAPSGSFPTFSGSVVLAENEILIKTGSCCGKPSNPMIICRRSDEDNIRMFLNIGII